MTLTWPTALMVRDLTAADATQIALWRYRGRSKIYDGRSDALLTGDDGYWAVSGPDGNPLVGFCCHGVEARVPGLSETAGVVDIGVGMNPAFVGQGHGPAFGAAVVDHVRALHGPVALRAVVQSWNERSLRLTAKLGFEVSGRHVAVQNGEPVVYLVLTNAAARVDV